MTPSNFGNTVQLDELSLLNFRNIEKAKIAPAARFNVISGKNGMGKTNIIEAIYMLGALRSFRTSVRRELISYGQEKGIVRSVFGSVNAGLKCEIKIGPKEREILSDGKKVSASTHFQILPMVLFYPQMMELVQGGPEFRRRFIDRALFQANSFYPSLHRNYMKVLANRNSMLRQSMNDLSSLLPFDLQLADMGSQMVEMRKEFVESMLPFFGEAARSISDGARADLKYRPKITGDKDEYLSILQSKISLDSDRKYTTAGPHADDLVFELEGRPARKFASQGQQRTLVLAAKIAETKALTDKTNRTPLLLFDDVSSELDQHRNRHLFEFLKGMGGQVFITTTHPDYINIDDSRMDFTVADGTVVESGR